MRYKRLTKKIIRPFMALLIIQLGCAPRIQKLPQPPSEHFRGQLGTIGVVSADFIPTPVRGLPTKGWARGAARGAWEAEDAVLRATTQSGSDELGAFCCLVATPFALCIGGLKGAIEAPSVKAPTAAALGNVLKEMQVQEKMRDHILGVAQKQTRHSFVVLEGQGPNTRAYVLSYGFLSDRGIDTVLEVSVMNVDLRGKWKSDSPVTFFITIRTRLIRVVDGEVLYVATLIYQSTEHKSFDWEANDFKLFREEFTRCYVVTAEKIVEELFLLYLF
jgi:hypothetical protein